MAACFVKTSMMLRKKGEREMASKREGSHAFYNLIVEMTSDPFCHMSFRSKSPGPLCTHKRKGLKKGVNTRR